MLSTEFYPICIQNGNKKQVCHAKEGSNEEAVQNV